MKLFAESVDTALNEGLAKMTGENILCISSIDWGFIWQGHQEIMTRLARQGNRVLFIENTGVRAPGLRDMPRLRQRLRNWRKSTKGFRQEAENLFIYSPVILPFPYSRPARWINRMLLMSALNRWMRATNFSRPVLWTFLPTPLARDLIREIQPKLTIYYCIDDFASSSAMAGRIRASEAKMFQEADLVFVTSEKLRQRACSFNPQTHFFPFAVDFQKFENMRLSPQPIPQDIASLNRPIIGYVGGLHQWIDQDLLAAVAEKLPEMSFVLIGPAQTDISRLKHCANIHLLGARPHNQVPGYIKAFDAGIIPYRLTEYTNHVYPTKLNEYLAMGIPAVSTDLIEIRRFNAAFGEVVAIGKNPESFAEALRRSVDGQALQQIQRRIEVARQNSWESRVSAMIGLIGEAFQKKQAKNESWDVILRRLYHQARRRGTDFVLTFAVSYLFLFHTPFLWLVASPLKMTQPIQQADAVVVLAGGMGESGKAGSGYQERVKQAVDLYKSGKAPKILFCSGYTFVFREAEVMKELAMANGVPESAIELEMQGINTAKSITDAARQLRRESVKRVLLVSSPYHMRRAVLTWRKLCPDIAVISAPVPKSHFYDHVWGARLEQIEGIVHEYCSLLYYWMKGWL